jgi:hypothetical protein
MKRMLPNGTELAILFTSAVLCAAMLVGGTSPNILPVVVFPLVLTAMLMGAKRTGQLSAMRQPVARAEAAPDKVEQSA